MRRILIGVLLAALSSCTSTPAPSPPPSATADPVTRGGVLRVATSTMLANLDPWTSSDVAGHVVLRQVFETLVDLEPGGYGLIPGLAERWSASTDGLVWTFRLRGGVRFHDGTLFDSAAVVANVERARAFARFDLGALVSEVTAADSATVVFRLRAPFAPFPATLASPSFGMVSPACPRQGPAWATPETRCAAGTGPFRLEPGAWRGAEIGLVRNTSYWAADAAGRALPYLDGVTFLAMSEEAARAAALRSAAVDVALDVGVAGARAIRADPKAAVARRPVFETSFLGVGPAPALARVELRRAIAMALDRAAIVQTVYGGDARSASQLIPPGLLGHDSTITQFTPNDVPAAKRLLTESGAALPAATDLWFAADGSPALPDPRRVAEALAADLGKIGLEVTPRPERAATLEAEARAGRLALWIGTRAPARADPDDFVADVSADPIVQELLRRARAEPDGAKRAELYKQVTKLAQQEVLRIPLFHAGPVHGVSAKVRGLVPQALSGEPLAAVWIGR